MSVHRSICHNKRTIFLHTEGVTPFLEVIDKGIAYFHSWPMLFWTRHSYQRPFAWIAESSSYSDWEGESSNINKGLCVLDVMECRGKSWGRAPNFPQASTINNSSQTHS